MVEKGTRMLIKVDLQCPRCYKKIKKILCDFPEIRDQRYDEKGNTVEITVVRCSPKTIQQEIKRKGRGTVQTVEILPDKPKEPEKKPEKETPKPPAAPKPPQQAPPPPPPKKEPNPVAGYPPMPVYPMVPLYPMVPVCCCPPFYGGYGGGPCYCGRRRPVMCYDGCGRPAGECQGGHRGSYPGLGRPVMCDDGCGRPACKCQSGNRGCYVSRCDYFSEENANACTVM